LGENKLMDDYRTDTSSMGFDNWGVNDVSAGAVLSAAPTRHVIKSFGSAISLSGALVLPGALAVEQERKVLCNVLRKMERSALISAATLEAALDFVDALGSAPLPKVAPDSDGGVLMAWTGPDGDRTLVTLEDSRIDAVLHAGTSRSEYIDGVLFSGDVPAEIVKSISA
jgi:hypothetical protein